MTTILLFSNSMNHVNYFRGKQEQRQSVVIKINENIELVCTVHITLPGKKSTIFESLLHIVIPRGNFHQISKQMGRRG